ncbi:unnamed protein product [Clonostachys rhizophaga]|uniref:Uncharacterized protein n=1 Tax=Clonostachys rhizophaga TaxID=160324 RepID=A0A9N9UX70_9HYPO|nr:unnamed protein product [Clonostachys rhizophaga]
MSAVRTTCPVVRNILSFPWEATELGKAASREDAGGGGLSAVASREGNGDSGREGGGALGGALIVITLIVVALIVILSVIVITLIIVATVVAAVVTTIVSSVVAVSTTRSRGDAGGAGARDSDGGVDGGLDKGGPGETALDDGGRNIGDNGDDRSGQAGLVGRTRGDGSASGGGSRRVGPESGAAGEDRSIAGDVLVDQRRGNARGIRDGADCGGQGNGLGDNGSCLGGLGKVVDVSLLGGAVGDGGSTASDGRDLGDANGQGGLRGCFVESTTVPVEVTGRMRTGNGGEDANSSNGSLHLDCYFGNETELWVVVVIELKSRVVLSRRRVDCEQSEFD